ncbi:MAG: hypothetical protein LBS38_00270 [Endomicrobium sp.]|jgi:hypothetical protein|nr:hypothetical protein [Endomicrobium sp.]
MPIIKTSALEMIKIIAARVGLADVSTIEDISTSENRLLLASLNAANTKIITSYMWNELVRRASFTADESKEGGYDSAVGGYNLDKVAPGFLGFMNKYILFETTNQICSFAMMDEYLASFTKPSIYKKFVIKQNCVCFLNPQPSETEICTFHYRTIFSVMSNNGALATETNEFRLNEDTWILNDQLLIQAAVLEYKQNKGIPSQVDATNYQQLLNSIRDSNAADAILGEYPSNAEWAFKMSATKDSFQSSSEV